MVAAVTWARPKDVFVAPPQVAIKLKWYTDFVTFDGGAHWQLLPGLEQFLLEWLATYHGTTLALLESGDGSVNLWSSTDQLQTWRELKQAPYGQTTYGQPSINPATGDVLVVGQTSSGQMQINASGNLGQNWTSFPTPIEAPALAPIAIVSPPAAGQPWRICGIATTSSSGSSSGGPLMCSMDGGRTWTQRPQLALTAFGNVGPFTQVASEFAVSPDGTVFAQIGANQWGSMIPQGLYQLAPDFRRWQSVGPLPWDEYDTADIPGVGILWAMNGSFGFFADAAI